jgi:transposase
MHKEVLKGTRWLLLKNPENLDEKKGEKRRLEEALALNQPLATALYLKDNLRRFWEQPGKRFATTFLDGWIRRAEASGIRMLQQMSKTLAAHRSGLLAYYDVMISSGPLEGTNNKIKTMKRQAYGFRDLEFFKLKILAIHETTYALVG